MTPEQRPETDFLCYIAYVIAHVIAYVISVEKYRCHENQSTKKFFWPAKQSTSGKYGNPQNNKIKITK